MKQHKWHKEIKAWADGAVIQADLSEINEQPLWTDIKHPRFEESTKYRIKPQPKEPQYLDVYFEYAKGNHMFTTDKEFKSYYDHTDFRYIGKIKLEETD